MDVGLGSYLLVTTTTSHQVRAGIPGREPVLHFGNCLSPGRGWYEQQGLSVFREAWLLGYGTVSV